MAIAYVKDTGKVRDNVAGSTIAMSFATLPSAGNLIVVYVWGWDSTSTWSLDSCTDNQGNTYARAAQADENDKLRCAIFYAYNIGIPSGTFTVTVTASEEVAIMIGAAVEYSGALTTDPLDKVSAGATGNSTTPSTATTDTLTQADELVTAIMANTASGVVTVTPPTDYTSRVVETDNDNWQSGEGADRIVSATTAQNPTWTLSPGGPWTAIAATFKAAGAVGGARISTLGLMGAG